MKKLLLVKKEYKIRMNFIVEYLFKKSNVEIDLFPEKRNVDEIIKQVCKELKLLKEEVKILKMNKNENKEKENKELKNSIENLKKENISLIEEFKSKNENIEKENKELKNNIQILKEEIKEKKKILEPINNQFQEKTNYNKSVIMKENEINLINSAIKSRLNKGIKELKNLYQATIDGDTAKNFHSKCDYIPNTLVLIKSAEIEDLEDLQLKYGKVQMANIKMIKMHFYFVLINKKFILKRMMEKLFIVIKNMDQLLEMVFVFI